MCFLKPLPAKQIQISLPCFYVRSPPEDVAHMGQNPHAMPPNACPKTEGTDSLNVILSSLQTAQKSLCQKHTSSLFAGSMGLRKEQMTDMPAKGTSCIFRMSIGQKSEVRLFFEGWGGVYGEKGNTMNINIHARNEILRMDYELGISVWCPTLQ